MKERPILMNTESVAGIIDDRKTQTRRILKLDFATKIVKEIEVVALSSKGQWLINYWKYKCPYGKIGDRLWVRETWGFEKKRYIKPSINTPVGAYFEGEIFYKADDEYLPGMKWRPSIHMFRKDSRINLEITDIRVEKINQITGEDCIEEGVPQTYGGFKGFVPEWASKDKNDASYFYDNRTSRENFYLLWNSINAKRGYGWETNPYVWCISFKILD